MANMVTKRIFISIPLGYHRSWVKQGRSYLIEEEKSRISSQIFKTVIEKGFKGLCFTPIHPSILKKEYKLRKAQIIWFSKRETIREVWLRKRKTPSVLSPIDLGRLVHIINEFTTKNKESVVLLDGLEYLITNNSFSIVARVMTDINEIFMANRSILLAPTNPKAFDEKELAILERNFEVIKVER